VELAALAEGPDGKLRHQWRIPKSILTRWAQLLRARGPDLRRCPDFETLHAAVKAARIRSIGTLTVYDTALRIGAKLGLEPAVVHLHAGTREGAKALGLNGSRQSISPRELPTAFRQLRPREIEDCLCIYADALARVARSTGWRPVAA
jgi:hypothetical protein